MDQAMGTDAAEKVKDNDPFVAWKGLQESLRNLSASVGETVMPIIVPALNSLAGTINSFAAAVQGQDPRVLTGAGIAAAGVAGYGAYKTVSGIWALTTAGTSLQTAAVMLQEAAIAQGGGGIVKDAGTAAGWGATALSWVAGLAAATVNAAQTDSAKTAWEVERKNREQRALDAYFANKKTSGWREILFGDAANDENFSLIDHMRVDPGGKDRAGAGGSQVIGDSEFGLMLKSVAAALDRQPVSSGSAASDKALDTGEYVSAAQNAGAQAKQALDITAAPKIDQTSIDAFLAKVRAAAAELQHLATSATNIRSNVDSEMRRAYSDYGVAP
jgi:hypothetical protein